MSEDTVKKRNVSFPSEDSDLVTATYGPEDPWFKDEEITGDFLIGKYRESCVKHNVEPLSKVLDQLTQFDYHQERVPCLDLSGTQLEFLVCESLEEILKRVRFQTIDLENTQISEEGAVAMFEMVEYYEACETLNISRNEHILARGWQACSRMIKKTQSLRELVAKETCLKEEFIPFLARTLKIGTHLSVLNLERCRLNGRPITMLANALRMNRSLQEIYLGENQLESMDAYNLSNLLTHNCNLQLLDLSNNIIGDKGAQHLCLCLAEKVHTTQRSPQSPTDGSKTGLLVLVLWNNCLTQLSGQHFAKLVEKYSELEVLNVGHNNLTDAWLRGLREPLRSNHSLYLLGLQSTKLTAASAREMAAVFEHNTTLQRVDLRDNHLRLEGVQELKKGLESNSHLTQLDLDQHPAYLENSDELTQYEDILKQIHEKIVKNGDKTPPQINTSKIAQNVALASRKISLTCEIKIPQTQPKKSSLSSGRLRSPAPSPTPSPILSPIPSPGGKSRFSVSKVQDAPPKLPPTPEVKTSRFSITPVKDIPKIILPEEKVTVGFQIENNSIIPPLSPEKSIIFKFDPVSLDKNNESDQNSNIENSKNNDIKKSEVIMKNEENFNDENDNLECDSEVEGITSNIKNLEFDDENTKSIEISDNAISTTIDTSSNESSLKNNTDDKISSDIKSKSSYILEMTPKDTEKLETVTEMNPAYMETIPEVITRPGILSKRSKIANTYPPRIDDSDNYNKCKESSKLSDNSQITKTESKSTLQNLFALFQNPSISFSSTASAFYAKTEAKMSQIVPSLSSITLNYEPFKFNTKHTTTNEKISSKTHLDKHTDVKPRGSSCERLNLDSSSTKLHYNTDNKVLVEKSDDKINQIKSTACETTKLLKEEKNDDDLESKLEIRMGKKRKSKKKNIVDNSKKDESFWDFGDETQSVPSTSN